MSRCVKSLLLAGSAVCILSSATIQAHAGAFALREQSAYAQGTSFAGAAAGGALSAMFWNPATMTQYRGWAVEGDVAAVFPFASHMVSAGTLAALGGAGNSGVSAAVPSAYGTYQISPNVWLGMSFNAPFGLSVTFPNAWAGRGMAAGDSSLKTYNAAPSLAVRINDWISVGVGVQMQYAKATLNSGVGLASTVNIDGNGWGYGWTAGITLTPMPGTEIGLGYRSAIDQKIDGTLAASPALFATDGSVNTTLNLPGTLSLGIRQRINQAWMVMGTVEWTNWSRIGTSPVYQASGAPAGIAFGTVPIIVNFNYSDGWLISGGAEYQWTQALALRAGIGFERSPLTDNVRTALVPDSDRLWVSGGLTYAITPSLKLDLAYSHLFMRTASISSTAGGLTYVGSSDPQIDIVSLALRYQFAAEPPARKILPTK
jgi:long-chain fatty acid transport protein